MSEATNSELIQLAKQRFDSMNQAEEKLFQELPTGRIIKFSPKSIPLDLAHDNNPETTLRAECLQWLCSDSKVRSFIPGSGLRLESAWIIGDLELDYIQCDFPLQFDNCIFLSFVSLSFFSCVNVLSFDTCSLSKGIDLSNSKIKGSLDLRNSEFIAKDVESLAIDASEISVDNRVSLSDNLEAFGEVSFENAIIKGILDFSNGHFTNREKQCLNLINLEVARDVYFGDLFYCEGYINLTESKIRGNLEFTNCSLNNGNEDVILADNLHVNYNITFDEACKINGGIDFYGSQIGGEFIFDNGTIKNQGESAICLSKATIAEDLSLRNKTNILGSLLLSEITVNGSIELYELSIDSIQNPAIICDNSIIKNDFIIENSFHIKGGIHLEGADIGRFLICRDGLISNENNTSFNASDISVGKSVYFDNNLTSEGNIIFKDATVKGNMNLSNTIFKNCNQKAFSAKGANFESYLFFENINVECGEVNLDSATINGNLSFKGANLKSDRQNKRVLALNSTNIKGSLLLNHGFLSKGMLELRSCKIQDNLDCTNGTFGRLEHEYAINAKKVIIGGDVFLRGEKSNAKSEPSDKNQISMVGKVDFSKADIGKGFYLSDLEQANSYSLILNHSSVKTLHDKEDCWPLPGSLFIEGLQYQFIDIDSPRDDQARKYWLRLQTKYSPFSYRQLAQVLDNIGCDKYAKAIRIAMNEDWKHDAKRAKGSYSKDYLKLKFLGNFIDYGYHPFKVWKHAAAIWLIGALIYMFAYQSELLQPPMRTAWQSPKDKNEAPYTTKYPHYHAFQALVYSLDVFLPIVDLHQEKYYLPKAGKYEIMNIKLLPDNKEVRFYNNIDIIISWGGLVRVWMYFQILSGWFLTTMLIGGISGLLKQK